MNIFTLVYMCVFMKHMIVLCQDPDDKYWDELMKSGIACRKDTCRKADKTCECYLTIEHRLTMMNEQERSLLKPSGGRCVRFNDSTIYSDESDFITGDGYGSRMIISVNRRFPGPPIIAYENQNIIVHMRNKMHTDSTTIHFHGMHQKGSPWSDGVAFVSQCPVLPGQTFTYSFYAKPFGTSFYHAHIGDQRSAGLYGPLIVIPLSADKWKISSPQDDNDKYVHTVTIQDWNHDDDPETLYQRMLFGVFDVPKKVTIETTSDISGANFSRFHCHSGLINGKGRFYRSLRENNEAPLSKFNVRSKSVYRFRVIGAATLYPFRVYVQNHPSLEIVASDGFEIEPIEVESFIIQPGERIDFLLKTSQPIGNYLLVAETIEVEPENKDEYHAAEAIIQYYGAKDDLIPPKSTLNTCSPQKKCKIFNCPYLYYPTNQNRICLTWNDVKTIDPNSNLNEIKGKAIERFYNFAFPGENGYTPGSVNGRQFLPPTFAAYADWHLVKDNCGSCSKTKICECTYYDTINSGNSDEVYQFVLTNIGVGAGWSHPIHLHGHSFYVMKMGFASYDKNTGKYLEGQDKLDIICDDGKNFCTAARWRNPLWADGNHPTLNWNNPPQKDTIIVPTGGYVVIRFKADNPGVWFFHCHIDLHNTNGMGMMINESPYNRWVPEDFPRCKDFQTATKPGENRGAFKVTIYPTIQTAVIGDNVTIQCFISGKLKVNGWYWIFFPLGNSAGHTIRYGENSIMDPERFNDNLTIINFSKKNEGDYLCFGRNVVGTSSSSKARLTTKLGKRDLYGTEINVLSPGELDRDRKMSKEGHYNKLRHPRQIPENRTEVHTFLFPNKKECVIKNITSHLRTGQSSDWPGFKQSSMKSVEESRPTKSQSRKYNQPYWWVDLGRTYQTNVKQIKIYNSPDCYGERVQELDVQVGPSLDNLTSCSNYNEQSKTVGKIIIPECFENIGGRFVKLVIRGSGCLPIEEFKVYGCE